jgi:hypothetical protein
MPTRFDLLDTRGWGSRPPRLDPPPPPAEPPGIACTFMDRNGKYWHAPRVVELDCVPPTFTRLDPLEGRPGWIRRTWTLGPGHVYWEQAPRPFVPTAYKPGGGIKHGQQGPKVEEESWSE